MIKKSIFTSTLAIFCTLLFSSALIAQTKRPALGLGVMIGEPTGVSVKKYLSTRNAFDVGAAWSLANHNEALHLHTNLLFQDNITKNPNLYFYHGVGVRALFASEARFGIRAPFGLTFLFPNIPFDMFVEGAPILDFTPDVAFAGNGGFGFRYYF